MDKGQVDFPQIKNSTTSKMERDEIIYTYLCFILREIAL